MKQATNPLWQEFIKAIKMEVVPALGCTEPISLAFAAATAAKRLAKPVERIEAKVSANLMKNGMGVTVPGTGTTGLLIAAAVGALGGDPDGKLEVLKKLTAQQIAAGKKMIEEEKVVLTTADVDNILYSEAKVIHGKDWVRVCIADYHTQVILIEENGEVVYRLEQEVNGAKKAESYSMAGVRAQDVFDFAVQAPLEMISFIGEAARLNDCLSKEGMSGQYGLHIGATLCRQIDKGLMADGLLTHILMRTTAASDARMGGATLPAMTNSGSGNQGITATMPVLVVAEHLKASQETTLRALLLSHLMAIYIHSKLPKLSALCAVTTAAMGAAAGMAYLLKGDFETVSMAISSMIGDLAGMICDGASNSCAMKVSTSVAAAYKAVLMALEGMQVTGNEGIVADDVDDSIANLGELACRGMVETDDQILKIMLNKA
ncbi:serine dehydratase subunit alpha family protein [Azotosporobacter soli]|uniref:L-cysteine desulfidase family protein n=1 Tax=Azotosporobacter soli TaxID=3055040 RepID=UPI0031FEC424